MLQPDIIETFRTVFYPRSIAVVGASSEAFKSGRNYLAALLNSGYKGAIYAVNNNAAEALGLKTYPSISSIPDMVEYVIVAVPINQVLAVLEDCAVKRVKVVQFFTAGFRELGKEGELLEQKMLDIAKRGGFRIIGPNCIGCGCPAHNFPLAFISKIPQPGPVAFISQSGGHAESLYQESFARGIHFSKIVSYGNGCDLNSPDFLEYFIYDNDTKIVGAYIEGVRDAKRFFKVISKLSRLKPVVIWKGGVTAEGARAAASHTGSLAASHVIWSAALKQAGVIQVKSLEEMADTLLLFQQLGIPGNMNVGVALLTGIIDGGGGMSVAAADILTLSGLNLHPFGQKTREALLQFLPKIGTILRNPLDVGGRGWRTDILEKSLQVILEDPAVGILIIHERIDDLLTFQTPEVVDKVNETIIKFHKLNKKPFMMILPHSWTDDIRMEVEKKLSSAGIPVFPALERAAVALKNLNTYINYRNRPEL